MLSDEEKQAIKYIKNILNYEKLYYHDGIETNFLRPVDKENVKIVLNLIEKQSKEIEHQKEKRENQKQELAILNAKQIEFNKLVNTVNSYKGQFKRQQKEIEELKEKNKTQSDCAEPIERIEEMVNMNWVNHNYIGKDKIKAKIEEYENKIKKIRSKKIINEPEDTIIITRYAHYISVLQSLLEKE